eukprot:110717-Chlamydomonas_euryale.AAC.1
MVLGNRPTRELTAFCELHERNLSFKEGSVLSPSDLKDSRAAKASAALIMANRFNSDVDTEDTDVLFRVWAMKAYTKCVPLTVQVSCGGRLRQQQLEKTRWGGRPGHSGLG